MIKKKTFFVLYPKADINSEEHPSDTHERYFLNGLESEFPMYRFFSKRQAHKKARKTGGETYRHVRTYDLGRKRIETDSIFQNYYTKNESEW